MATEYYLKGGYSMYTKILRKAVQFIEEHTMGHCSGSGGDGSGHCS